MQRTIEIADFDLPRGPVSVRTLIDMPEPDWEHLRLEITRRWKLDPARPLARCRQCEAPVYIKVQALNGERVPLFAHYKDEGSTCPWHQGNPLVPDDPRAAQYQGHQESALHRWLCQMIAANASADPRCQNLAIETYLRPSIAERGRYPDVYFELTGLGRFAVEVQLSKPFPMEIAARHIHYEREGVKLIWVFRELPEDLPQGFRDVIAFQRGNAFLFDDGALRESIERETLVLGCRLQRDGKRFLKERYVALDDLHLSSPRSVFLEDCRSPHLKAYCDAGRAKWMPYLRSASKERDNAFRGREWQQGWDSARMFVPELSGWKAREHAEERFGVLEQFVGLVTILFSIAKSAKEGSDVLYTSRYNGKGALVAMLNARLSSRVHAVHADLIETMLARTAMRPLLNIASLAQGLAQARHAEPVQVSPHHPVWMGVARIFPEVLDGYRRAEMDDLEALPAWAVPPEPRLEEG